MGMIWAKWEEERSELDLSRFRSAAILRNCRPEYVEDLELLGLAPEGDAYDDFSCEIETDMDQGDAFSDDEDGEDYMRENQMQKIKNSAREVIANDKMMFIRAAAKGKWLRLQNLLSKQHVVVDHTDNYGRCALYMAAERGHSGIVEILIGAAAVVDNPNNDNWTPLHAATFHGQVKVMDELLNAGAICNVQEKNGVTPLVMAVSSPKLYLIDVVSRTDRKRRKKIRLANNVKVPSWIGQSKFKSSDPMNMWRFYPNNIELIVLDRLLSKRTIQVDLADSRRRTPLIYAARFGRACAMSRLLHANANMKHCDADGRTALFHAACNGHLQVVDMLLQLEGNVNQTDGFFRTPLHGALEVGDEGMANLLLKAEASVNAYDCEGRTPIMLAMEQHNRRLFADLISRRSNLDVLDRRGWNVVIYAIETGMFTEVLPMLQKLGDRAQPILRSIDPQGRNALHHAAALPHLEIAARVITPLVVLDAEAAIRRDCNGDTAVHIACELGRLELVRLLTERLPSAELPNNRGETPLLYAAHGGHLACVVTLLYDQGRGALCDATAVDLEGRTLLMHACESGHLDLVNLLLQNREGRHTELAIPPLDVNARDVSGATALIVAAREGNWQILPSLVLAGANVAHKDDDGFTALHWGAVEDEGLVVRCLLDLGLHIDATDAKGWTALMHAVSRGCDDCVRLFVDSGCDIEARNWDGDTALQICMRREDRAASITRDILLDGLLGRGLHPSLAIPAQGHFMFSVINCQDLGLEGSAGDINSYVCLQFCSNDKSLPQVAFTSCALCNTSPEFHESFRFDTEYLDSSAYLVAWLMAAPGSDPQEVVELTALGATEEELADLHKQAMTNKQVAADLAKLKPEFTTALETSFSHMRRRADLAQDLDVRRLRSLATAGFIGMEPTEDLKLKSSSNMARISVEERRWQEVANLQSLLKRYGFTLPRPLAPRIHLPLGCVLVRFRHLRQAVWGADTVVIKRMLRLSCRGTMKLEIDFRPRFFAPVDPAPTLPRAEEEEMYEVHADGEFDESRCVGDVLGPVLNVSPPHDWRDAVDPTTAIMKQDQETLYKRFMRISTHQHNLMKAENDLAANLGKAEEKMAKAAAAVREASGKDAAGKMQILANFAGSVIARAKSAVKNQGELRKMKRLILDKPIEVPQISAAYMTKDQDEVVQGGGEGHREPWLEELMDCSRFV
eukprot:TRINITY_DN34702_c0_g2_i1.p1 TRINITY_DN34702_c0_g2~~TRINITY_DN34702_c0_g2_i1.p1  ORF type:complete len:1195 (-),score=227.09 TRINITY_DN34702_c0_g2_i1:38-3622(-)